MTRRFILCALLALGLGVFWPAHAAWPPVETSPTSIDYSDPANWPNDPGYAGLWQYWSFVPQRIRAQVDEVTKRLGTGGHYDRAWAKTTGDPRVIIAVTDSGLNWSSADLLNRTFLNRGELKPPEGCAGAAPGLFDRNGDGRFNAQDYTTATGHELPSFDKVCDPRVQAKGDTNKNGVLDGQDLIRTFSDGKDDDGNGYIDDISGWDFFENDNDCEDATKFGHGTGASRDSVAEGNDGRGDIGVCPDCTVIMLRVGDAFVPELNTWGMATMYAVDIGAAVVNVSGGGGLTNSEAAIRAIDYAYANNVTVVVSNSDLNSFHHNYPNHNNHAIAVHAIVHEENRWEDSTSFFNYNACTNYGANLMFSVPANGCSSEASGRSGGLIGLLYAAALKHGVPSPKATIGDPDGNRRLTAEEVRQLLTTTVDTFYDPADAMNPLKFPSGPGFVRRFGYGRPNPRSAVDAIEAGKLPPEIDLLEPYWYDTIYPDKTPTVPIVGRVAFRGMAQNPPGVTIDYVVEWAPGVDPSDDKFQTIGQGTMLSGELKGPLAMWNVANVEVRNPVPDRKDIRFQPDDPANLYTITVRARATLHSTNDPNLEGVKAETRKALNVYRDPHLLPGFPLRVGSSGEASPKVVDLDGDGKMEIILADSAGKVQALRADGTNLPGWPVKVELLPLTDPNGPRGPGHAGALSFTQGGVSADIRSPIGATPAVGDLDGDGRPEVVVATWSGFVWAWRADGSVVSGFPVKMVYDSKQHAIDEEHEVEDGFFASPLLADLDGDDKLDIVAGGLDARLYAWKGDGQAVAGFPVVVHDISLPDDPKADTPRQRQRIMGTPAAGDLNGDGRPDIAVATNESYTGSGRLYVVDARGMGAPNRPFLPGWPVSVISTTFLPVVAKGLPAAPVMADVDGDGQLEVVVSGLASVPRVYDRNGKPFGPAMANQRDRYGENSDALNPVLFTFVSYPSIADLDDDGQPDIVEGAAGTDAALSFASGGKRHDFEHHMGAWDARTGQFKRGFPRVMEDWQFFSTPIFADVDGDGRNNLVAGSGGYFLHGWDADGKEAAGFPKFTGGWILATPAVGDLDGDGKLELVVNTRNGWLYAWRTEGKLDGRVDWSSFHHDNQNSGNYSTPIGFGAAAAPRSGCACDLGGRSGGAPILLILSLLVAGLVYHQRRRRRDVC